MDTVTEAGRWYAEILAATEESLRQMAHEQPLHLEMDDFRTLAPVLVQQLALRGYMIERMPNNPNARDGL